MKSCGKMMRGILLGMLFPTLLVGSLKAGELKYPIKEPLSALEGARINPLAARLNNEGVLAIREVAVRIGTGQEEVGKAIASVATGRLTTMERVGRIQEETAEVIHRNTALLFENLDRLGRVEEELGNLIRDQASSRFETDQKIESVRAGLDETMTRGAAQQIAISQQLGKGEEEVGQAILAARVSPPGTEKSKKAEERLGLAILGNVLLHRRAAAEMAENQERLGRAVRDHTALLLSAAETLGRREERLGRTILLHARTLRSADEAIGKGQERLGAALLEGERLQQAAVAQFGRDQEHLGRAIQDDAVVRFRARGMMEEAVAKLIMATEFDPTFVLVHYNCGIAFLSRNRPEDLKNAIDHLEMGLAVEPGDTMLLAFHAELVGGSPSFDAAEGG